MSSCQPFFPETLLRRCFSIDFDDIRYMSSEKVPLPAEMSEPAQSKENSAVQGACFLRVKDLFKKNLDFFVNMLSLSRFITWFTSRVKFSLANISLRKQILNQLLNCLKCKKYKLVFLNFCLGLRFLPVSFDICESFSELNTEFQKN